MRSSRNSTASRMVSSRSFCDIAASKCSTFHQPTFESMNGGWWIHAATVAGQRHHGIGRHARANWPDRLGHSHEARRLDGAPILDLDFIVIAQQAGLIEILGLLYQFGCQRLLCG